jgi:5'-methylthioadenosine phosphorylase
MINDFIFLATRIIDRTKGIRPSSYFEKVGIVAHAMFGDAFDNNLSEFLAPKVRSCT